MPAGVKIKEIVVGTGAVAVRGKEVVVHYRGYLNRGEECCSSFEFGQPMIIDLDRRQEIPGLRMGIDGMREGGRRELVVSPHLAYGEAGIPGRIPANAVLRFEVELLEVREKGKRRPEDYQPGKQYVIFHPGEAKRNLPRWQVGLTEEGKCGAWITFPLPGGRWRQAPGKSVELRLSPGETALIKEELHRMEMRFPNDCLRQKDLWCDHSEQANAVTRDLKTNTLCVTVTVWSQGRNVHNFSVREDNPILLEAEWYRLILQELQPHLQKAR